MESLNEVVWEDFRDVGKKSKMHQRQRFEQQFEWLHSERTRRTKLRGGQIVFKCLYLLKLSLSGTPRLITGEV